MELMRHFGGNRPSRAFPEHLQLAPSSHRTECKQRDPDHPEAIDPGQRGFQMVGEPDAAAIHGRIRGGA